MSETDTSTSADAASEQDGTEQDSQGASTSADTGEELATLRAQLEAALKDGEKWKATSRKHEGRAKENADAASKAKTVEQQLEDVRKQLGDQAQRDAERNGRLALSQVETQLAAAGFNAADLKGLLSRIPPTSLLSEGEPDEKAIDELAKSLIKVGGRTTPDRDQGRRGGDAPVDMNTLIRRAAGVPI